MQNVEEHARLGIDAKEKADKRINHKDLILTALLNAGEAGCTSEELNKICFRYSGRIFDLRKDGWEIKTLARTGTELARFVCKGKYADAKGQMPLF